MKPFVTKVNRRGKYEDGKPYRKQVYALSEISDVIERFGFPQAWNEDGSNGPERYIEVQIWDDAPLKYMLLDAYR
ncbi:hypothetical protein [Paenibacillus sinopodophylli]|uniref:hypothetical protein n=1 Tax=Paenibacillus sinopodophylli TaxID=1837342 RepID=UPI00110D1EEE|nr:hypothetical protein [Paenibacillus sinopodophylli]